MCKKPFFKEGEGYGCGQCLPCRINHRRQWTARILLEGQLYTSSIFVTLTYDDDNLPKDGSLVKEDYQKFLKRLRKRCVPQRVRYFFVGEYGSRTGRAHYHAMLFGLDRSYSDCVASCWPKGNVHVGDLTPESAAYICGYVTKKMTSKDDERLNGRLPEFARMSLKPGIGAGAINAFLDCQTTVQGSKAVLDTGGVLSSFRYAGRMYPLGRYLRSLLRESVSGDRRESERAATQRRYHSFIESTKLSRDPVEIAKMRKQRIRNIESKFKVHESAKVSYEKI